MIQVLLCVGGVIFLSLGYWLVMQRKQFNTMQEQVQRLQKSLDQMEKGYPILVNADLLCAKQVREINTQILSMGNQLQELENKRDNDGGYQHALRILEMGGTEEEIMSSCHLSSAEAELLMNLQAYRTAIKSA